jgi:hypothetical protein
MRVNSVLSPATDRILRSARVVFGAIALVSALTVLAAFVLQRVDPDQVNWVVWLRAAAYTVGGVWLLTLVRSARQSASRAALLRLRVVCVLAPLGIAALVISPDSGYPIWMKVEQAFFGLMLAPLAVVLLRSSVTRDFRRARQATAAA